MPSEELPAALRPAASSRWTREITDADILRFAELSGDKGRRHLERDADGRLLAHGLLTATLPTKLGGDMNFIARAMTFKFLKPVRSGDRLECAGTVVSAAAQTSRYRVRISFTVRNQNGELVLRGDTSGAIAR